jgi:hypothetical protein
MSVDDFYVSRNRDKEAVQKSIKLLGPLPVATVSRVFDANRAAAPEPPECQAVDEIEVDHGVFGAIHDGQRDRRDFNVSTYSMKVRYAQSGLLKESARLNRAKILCGIYHGQSS